MKLSTETRLSNCFHNLYVEGHSDKVLYEALKPNQLPVHALPQPPLLGEKLSNTNHKKTVWFGCGCKVCRLGLSYQTETQSKKTYWALFESHHPAIVLKAAHCVHITALTCWTCLEPLSDADRLLYPPNPPLPCTSTEITLHEKDFTSALEQADILGVPLPWKILPCQKPTWPQHYIIITTLQWWKKYSDILFNKTSKTAVNKYSVKVMY